MAAMSDYLEEKIAQLMFKNNAGGLATPGDSLYVALFTASTGLEINAPTAEVVGGSYARQQVPAADWAQAGGAVENLVDILFPVATANWGAISHIAIMDAATVGNVLYHGALTTPRAVGSGDQFKINAGDLDVVHD